MSWLELYCASTPHVRLYDNTSVRLDSDNEVQSDALLIIEADTEKPILSEETDDYIESPPQLIGSRAKFYANDFIIKQIRLHFFLRCALNYE